MSVRVRFAPSPTGTLHVGGARTALYNYLFARAHGGTFVLRIEDTDAARSTEASLDAILQGMRWLGLDWDEGPGIGGPNGPYAQSERRERYHVHAATLEQTGWAYPCFCTAEALERRRASLAERREGAGLDEACRGLDPAERARRRAAGEPHALRFALPGPGEIAWDDVVRARVAFQNEVLDEFVLLRSDGLPTYNFACVVDDHEMAITHVIRGDDHISNTPRQLLLYQAFGWTPPQFAHVPMILGSDGARLSKRHGATSVAAYQDLGIVPEALVNFLALLGWSYDGQRELFTLPELERVFRLERVGANPAVFDTQKLEWMNGQHLKRLSEPERVARVDAFLRARGVAIDLHPPEWRTQLVRAIGDRLKTLLDAERYGAFALQATIEFEPLAWSDLLANPDAARWLDALAARLGSQDPWALEPLEAAVRALAAELGAKLGALIAPVRVALTGGNVSLGIFEMMSLLGRERTLQRLVEAAGRLRAEAGARD